MILQIYVQPLWKVVLTIVLLTAFWVFTMLKIAQKDSWKKVWRKVNQGLFILSIFLVLYTTIFSRSKGGQSEICLILFYSFVLVQKQPEIYRSMIMNVFLFVPFGLTLSQILPEQWGSGKRMITAICAGLILSCFVEGIQYMFSLGRAEIDDVLTNVIGTAIGTGGVYLGGRFLEKCRRTW